MCNKQYVENSNIDNIIISEVGKRRPPTICDIHKLDTQTCLKIGPPLIKPSILKSDMPVVKSTQKLHRVFWEDHSLFNQTVRSVEMRSRLFPVIGPTVPVAGGRVVRASAPYTVRRNFESLLGHTYLRLIICKFSGPLVWRA